MEESHINKRRNDVSGRMAEKMLQGWALLGATCPVENCNTPLVRNRQMRMYCVNCEQFVMTQDEINAANEGKVHEKVQETAESIEPSIEIESKHEQSIGNDINAARERTVLALYSQIDRLVLKMANQDTTCILAISQSIQALSQAIQTLSSKSSK